MTSRCGFAFFNCFFFFFFLDEIRLGPSEYVPKQCLVLN